MTMMYADMSADEVIEAAQAVTFEQIEKVLKRDQSGFFVDQMDFGVARQKSGELLWRRRMGIEPTEPTFR